MEPQLLVCLVFVDLFAKGGLDSGSSTLDTVADENRKMADGVTRSPARLCSRDRNLCYNGRLEYDFLAFVPCFLLYYFLLPYPGMFYLVPSSVQQSSTLSKYRI